MFVSVPLFITSISKNGNLSNLMDHFVYYSGRRLELVRGLLGITSRYKKMVNSV